MQYQYLRQFPTAILPRLEISVIRAEQAHTLSGHHGVESAVQDAQAFVVRAFCECASVVCDAVDERHIAYVDLSTQLDFLRRALIHDAFWRSDINYWRNFARGPDSDKFALDCNAWIDRSPEWRAVQNRRLALAESAVVAPATPPRPAFGPSSALFDAQRVLEKARAVLERSRPVNSASEPPSSDVPNSPSVVPSSPPPIATIEPEGHVERVSDTPTTAGTPLDDQPLLTVKEAADLLNCHEDTIRAMGERNEIEIIKIGPRGQRIKASEIERLLQTPKFQYR
jgi:excisionase family DNA binding protein